MSDREQLEDLTLDVDRGAATVTVRRPNVLDALNTRTRGELHMREGTAAFLQKRTAAFKGR